MSLNIYLCIQYEEDHLPITTAVPDDRLLRKKYDRTTERY